MRELLTDPDVGEMAICVAVHNEGRWISEFLLFHRLMGVDRFYLYDTGSDDDTLRALAPWIASGIVVLHQFAQCQSFEFEFLRPLLISDDFLPSTRSGISTLCTASLLIQLR